MWRRVNGYCRARGDSARSSSSSRVRFTDARVAPRLSAAGRPSACASSAGSPTALRKLSCCAMLDAAATAATGDGERSPLPDVLLAALDWRDGGLPCERSRIAAAASSISSGDNSAASRISACTTAGSTNCESPLSSNTYNQINATALLTTALN